MAQVLPKTPEVVVLILYLQMKIKIHEKSFEEMGKKLQLKNEMMEMIQIMMAEPTV